MPYSWDWSPSFETTAYAKETLACNWQSAGLVGHTENRWYSI